MLSKTAKATSCRSKCLILTVLGEKVVKFDMYFRLDFYVANVETLTFLGLFYSEKLEVPQRGQKIICDFFLQFYPKSYIKQKKIGRILYKNNMTISWKMSYLMSDYHISDKQSSAHF